MTRFRGLFPQLLVLLILVPAAHATIVDDYLNRYFATFPSAATAAGRYELDRELEDLDDRSRRDWLGFNREVVRRIRAELVEPSLQPAKRRDLELVLAEARRQVFDFEVLDRPRQDPLFWTGLLGNATVFLLVRDDRPLAERLDLAASRAEQIPRLTRQAQQALAATESSRISPELCRIAERQARSTARFYREGFPLVGAGLEDPELVARMEVVGARASDALTRLAEYLSARSAEATGSPALGDLYAESFRLKTGSAMSVSQVLADAEQALEAKVEETGSYGRSIWSEVFPPGTPVPERDVDVIRALFDRIGEDRASSTEEFVADYRALVDKSIEFVRRQEIISLPEPLTLYLGESPSFFIGQSVGGVYPAGPYAPDEAKTLLFLPVPTDDASASEREAFFRDFNHHFNVMITPHELIPGHYLQLKNAARHPHKVRALFGDGVYIEGWGTFCERLMLDLGWGGALDRIAHLKKQMENIARTIVDIRVHTRGMTRQEVLGFVRDEALQDEQFAGNMWHRAITSSPQLTTYFLGYQEVWGLYQDVKRSRGERFELKTFMDGMMELGPVAVEHYRRAMLDGSRGPHR